MNLRLVVLAICIAALPAWAKGKKPESKPSAVNVSGTWETANEGFYVRLRQAGDVVSGQTYKGSEIPVRGAWSADHLVLVVNWGANDPAKCERAMLVVKSKATVQNMEAIWFNPGGTRPDKFSRTSSDTGAAGAYPYAGELKACGDVLAYELTFDVGSDVLKNPDAPILAAVADVLKGDAAAKLRVVGHTDSTGDAVKNKDLSLRRADAVKKKLTELSGVDPGRIATEGLGPDQPLQDNGAPAGRAVNRRVEIATAR